MNSGGESGGVAKQRWFHDDIYLEGTYWNTKHKHPPPPLPRAIFRLKVMLKCLCPFHRRDSTFPNRAKMVRQCKNLKRFYSNVQIQKYFLEKSIHTEYTAWRVAKRVSYGNYWIQLVKCITTCTHLGLSLSPSLVPCRKFVWCPFLTHEALDGSMTGLNHSSHPQWREIRLSVDKRHDGYVPLPLLGRVFFWIPDAWYCKWGELLLCSGFPMGIWLATAATGC